MHNVGTDVPGLAPGVGVPIADAALEVLERLGVGIAAVAPSRFVLAASVLAVRVFGMADGLVVREGRLYANLMSIDTDLGQLLANGHRGAAQSRCLVVARPSGKPALLLVVVDSNRGCDTAAERVMMVWDSEQRAGWRAESLADLHGLTRAQARTVIAMFAEHSVPKVARRLGLSDNTVRTHLKQAFRRCGVHGWAQLAVLLAENPLRGSPNRVSRDK